jgi:hypothetical protein
MFRVVLSPIIRSAYNSIYSIWYLSHRYCYLPLSWKSWNRFECAVGGVAPDDGWKYHPKHVEQFPDINKLCNVSCWIYEYTGTLLGVHYILHISRISVKPRKGSTARLTDWLTNWLTDRHSQCPLKHEIDPLFIVFRTAVWDIRAVTPLSPRRCSKFVMLRFWRGKLINIEETRVSRLCT